MALKPRYLADKSALARFRDPAVEARLRPLLGEGRIATCAIVDLEVLYSARDLADYEEVLEERRSLPSVPLSKEIFAKAMTIQHQLARRGQHRVAIPDVIIAAAASSARLIVLHYDHDFDLIGATASVRHEWVVPRGSAG